MASVFTEQDQTNIQKSLILMTEQWHQYPVDAATTSEQEVTESMKKSIQPSLHNIDTLHSTTSGDVQC